MLFLRYFTLLCISMFSFQGFTTSFKPTPQRTRTTLRIGTIEKISRLDPLNPDNKASEWALTLINRPLFFHDQQGNMICPLCETVPSLENDGIKIHPKNSQRVSITITLRSNQRWGDGTKITVKDILTWWKFAQTSNQKTALSSHVRSFEEDPTSPNKIIIHLKNAEYEHRFLPELRLLPSHHFSTDKPSVNFMAYPNPGHSHTPWVLASHTQNKISFHQNPFSATTAGLEHIEIISFSKEKYLKEALQSNKIDITIETLTPLESHSKFHRHTFGPSQILDHFVINTRNPLLRSSRIRSALLALTKVDTEHPATTFLHPKSFSKISPPQTLWDPEIAAKNLKEQGWVPQKNGLYMKKGKNLHINLIYPEEKVGLHKMFTALKKTWFAHGIILDLEKIPKKDWVQRLKKSLFTGLAWTAWTVPIEVPSAHLFHSHFIPSDSNNFMGQNIGGYMSPDFDRTLNSIRHQFKAHMHIKKLHHLQNIFLNDPPILPLQYRSWSSWIAKDLQGYRLTYSTEPSSRFAENWYWPHFMTQ
ncbi:MAG: ABC transporter substrate-binding protein [Oligoflexales bacterium]